MANTTNKDEFIVALDIGTTKVLCLVADYDENGEIRLVGVGQEACSGLNKGVISEIDATVNSIRKAKDQARTMTNCKFTKVITGIAGNHIQSYNGNAAINILNDREQEIISARKLSEIPKTLEELSKTYKISRERVRQIEEKAFAKLQLEMVSLAKESRLISA